MRNLLGRRTELGKPPMRRSIVATIRASDRAYLRFEILPLKGIAGSVAGHLVGAKWPTAGRLYNPETDDPR